MAPKINFKPMVLLDERHSSAVGRLSLRAIELGYASAETNPRRLTAFLYFYNRIPLSQKWITRLPDEKALMQYMGLESSGKWPWNRNIQLFSPGLETPESFDNYYWNFWRIGRKRAVKSNPEGRYKLYICPV